MSARIAWAIEYDKVHVICVAPCCGMVVRHGSCCGGSFDGNRGAHCACGIDYYVKKGEYTRRVQEVNYREK